MTPETITVAVAQEFAVRLKSTPTTGYVWEVQKLPDGIQSLGSDYEKPGSDIKPGAPVLQVFRFKVQKAGEYTITFVLKRQWETKAVESHTVAVTAN
ncbi:MAG TPA: protease inhibitor I42 family protein [Methylomirabilota bacterium]|nr:protease inhibitor I42 family protein [Methylomirabilota bacterium]